MYSIGDYSIEQIRSVFRILTSFGRDKIYKFLLPDLRELLKKFQCVTVLRLSLKRFRFSVRP